MNVAHRRTRTLVTHLALRLALAPILLAPILLASCEGAASSDPDTGAIILSSDDVAALLGISDQDQLEVGQVRSDASGVTVDSVSYDDGHGTEVEVQGIQLVVVSPESLVYEIQSLTLDRIEFLDWATAQRTEATGLEIVRPGPGFLSAIEELIANAGRGDGIDSTEISFEALKIERVDYLRSDDKSVLRMGLDRLAVDDAGPDRFAELAVGRIQVSEDVSFSGLRITNVDRRWADFLMSSFVLEAEASGEDVDAGSSGLDADRTGSTTPDAVAAEFDTGIRVVPFDRFEIGDVTASLPDSTIADGTFDFVVTDFVFEVRRARDGAHRGLEASAHVDLAVDNFGTEAGRFFMAIHEDAFSDVIGADVRIEMTQDAASAMEDFHTLSVEVPNLGSLSGTMRCRNLASSFAKFLVKRVVPEDFDVQLQSLSLEFRDDGLFRYLVSERHPDHERFADGVRDMNETLADGPKSSTNEAEMRAFLQSPKVITATIEAREPTPPEDFFRAFFEPRLVDPGAGITTRLTFSP